MRTVVIIVLAVLASAFSLAQPLDYQAETIRLIPDESYLPDADWESLFYDWEHTSSEVKTGLHKDFAIAPDGRIVISNRSNYSVYILDKTGKKVKTFGRKGGKPGEFLFRQDFHGILDGKHLVFSDHQGRINYFDLEGNFEKMITIDYMPLGIYPYGDGQVIIKGHVPMKTYARKVLAVLDYDTEKYDIFYSHDEQYKTNNRIILPGNAGQTMSVSPSHAAYWITRVTPSGKIITARSQDQQIKVFAPKQASFVESGFEVSIEPIPITSEDKMAYYENFKNSLKKMDMDTVYAEKIKSDDYFPEHLPYYYNILVDESNNIMFFIYNNEDKDHLFKAYTTAGEYLGESEFIIEGYDILFQTNPVIIKDGYLYATALKENARYPLRIIKCRMVSE